MKLFDIIQNTIPGDWGSDKHQESSNIAVKCLRSADIVSIYRFDYSGIPIRYVSHKSLENRQLQNGDIVIEKSGGTDSCSTGRPIYISSELLKNNKPLLCSNFCSAIRLKDGWNTEYVYYLLRQIHKLGLFFNFEGKTSGIHNLDMEAAFNAIEIPDISYKEQESIATILSSLDRKIALNRKENEILEKMAKQLYDYWFVQFDFPDENGRPYKSSGGAMEYNPILKREIPKGWEVKNLFNTVDLLYGFPFSTELFTEEKNNKPVIRIRDIQDGSISAYTTESVDDKYLLNEGDLIIGMDGNFHMNYWYDNKTYLNQRCLRIRQLENSNLSTIQIFHSIRPYIKAKEKYAKGSTVGHLLDSDLRGIIIIEPQGAFTLSIKNTLDNILNTIIKNIKETHSLTSLRDFLLPLLMNEQVTIKK